MKKRGIHISLDEKDTAIGLYTNDGLSSEEIANIIGISRQSVNNILKHAGFELRRGGRIDNIAGKHYNDWTVLDFDRIHNGEAYWNCKCSCGKVLPIGRKSLVKNKSKGCPQCYPNTADIHKINDELVLELHNVGGLSGKEISLNSGLSTNVVYKILRRYGIAKGRNSHNMKIPLGTKFGHWEVLEFDTNKYGESFWLCKCVCGKTRSVSGSNLRNGGSKSCGCKRIELYLEGRKRNKTTRNSKCINNGYVVVYNPKHPNARKDGYVPEHVLVMSEHLCRQLFDGETVHHINGIKCDNNISNLELWSSIHPSGQRVSDMVDFCISFLSRYKPDALMTL